MDLEQKPEYKNISIDNLRRYPPTTSGTRSPDRTIPTLDNPPTYVEPSSSPPPKQRWYHKLSTKQWILVAVAFFLIIGGCVAVALTRPHATHTVSSSVKKTRPSAPKSVVSPLTGLPVSEADAKRPVTGVMIENSTFARPQSGLKEAGIVFEAIAEAGITRFLALFQETQPGNVGPVRSARPYFVDWAQGFDASLAHVGGSPEALQHIKDIKARDLDQFSNADAYHRISSRAAPHNVYTGMANLNTLEAGKGYTSSTFTGFVRKKDEPSKQPNATFIDFAISGPTYNVHYDYDKTTNMYKRSLAGEPHLDAETKQQLEPKVVIGMVMPYGIESDGYHSTYQNIGTGLLFVFQDGNVTNGTWDKATAKSPIVMKDTAGKTIALDPGQVWITALSSDKNIAYKP